jgi:Flp pilus assembly protein TadD
VLRVGLELEGSSPLEALAAYQRAVELDPWMADAHVNLGRLYHLTGERGRAEAHYRDAVRLAPEDPVPHFDLGVLLEEQGRREEAVNAYQQR